MGTIIINGKRYDGNSATIRGGKVVIDGKAQDAELHGNVELQAAEGISGGAECVATVRCSEVRSDSAVGASVTAGARAGGGIRAVAIASASKGSRKRDKL
jgi:formylmethanofuran dehydrogenase subunit C